MMRLGTIEVNEMQSRATAVLETLGHVERIVGIDFRCVISAFGQAHTLSAYYVDGRYNLYHISRKCFNMSEPTPPLFSGWNCVE